MKVSHITYLERGAGKLTAAFSAEGYSEHGALPGIVDLGEYLDILLLEEKALLGDDGHRTPVTILALNRGRIRLDEVEAYVEKPRAEGPFHAAWTAGRHKIEFLISSTQIDGMRALRDIYEAATMGRAFAAYADVGGYGGHGGGLKLVAITEDERPRTA